MTELLTHDLVHLARPGATPRLSLFLPVPPGRPRSAVRARARSLLDRAERELREEGLTAPAAGALVERVRRVLARARPRSAADRGLAVFADADAVSHVHVPLTLPELAVVGDRFTVAPLLPVLGRQGRFFLLALSHEEIRLFRGTARSLEPVDVEGLPLAAWTTMPRRTAHVHAVVADRGGHGSRAVFHGERAADDRKPRALQHFRGADRALREVLQGEDAPLVLAGVRYLQSLYRSVNSYPHLVADGIDGSPDRTDGEELHRQAWALAEAGLHRRRSAVVERYRALRGTGRTAGTAGDAHDAAVAGRVETLLVDEAACAWPPADGGRTVVRVDPPAGDPEPVEPAVLATLRRSGEVVVLPSGEMPEESPLAAILRY